MPLLWDNANNSRAEIAYRDGMYYGRNKVEYEKEKRKGGLKNEWMEIYKSMAG